MFKLAVVLGSLFVSQISLACPDADRFSKMASMSPEEISADAKFKAKLSPDNKKILGMTLEHIAPCGLYDTMGFKKDDTLIEVDGVAFNSPSAAMVFYGALKSEQPFRVTILREGKTQVLTIK